MGGSPAFLSLFPPPGGFRAFLALSRRRNRAEAQQFPHPHQVVGRKAEQRLRRDLGPPPLF